MAPSRLPSHLGLRILGIAIVAALFLIGPFALDSFGRRTYEGMVNMGDWAIGILEERHEQAGRYPTIEEFRALWPDAPDGMVYVPVDGGRDFLLTIGDLDRDGWTASRTRDATDWTRIPPLLPEEMPR